jgi:hypothetical protein
MLAQYAQLLLSLAVTGVRGQLYAQSKHAISRNKRLTRSRRREHTVPGLGFRFTSPESTGLDCDDNRLSDFTAGIEVKANYTESCYNIADIFAWRDANQTAGRIDRSCHWDSDSCPNEWRYLDHSNFNPNATHSIVTVVLAGDRMSERLDGPAQVFRTFEHADCDENGDWHQWTGCEDERDECRELPYGIRSFHVSYQSEETRADECVFAGERGEVESGSGIVNLDAMIMFAMVAGIMVLVQ